MGTTNSPPVPTPQSDVPSVVGKLTASAIPFIISPTGSMANNGVVTLGTALPTTYANAYIYLPAGAVFAGSIAGWYFVQMSSTTVGTVFNNGNYVSGSPTIPGTLVPFVTTGPGAYTGVTTAVIGPQIPLPPAPVGLNGVIRISEQWSTTNSAGAKTLASGFSGTNVRSAGLTTSNGYVSSNTLYMRGSLSAQLGIQLGLVTGGVGLETGNNSWFFVNFANAQTYQLTGTIAVATDFIVMEGFMIELIP